MTDRDDQAPYADDDTLETELESDELVTNDAVAGDTVLPGAGDGNDGPTGGAPGEASPLYDEHGPEDDDEDEALDTSEAFDVGLDGERHDG